MVKYYVVAYLDKSKGKEIIFYRTTSPRLLNKFTDKLNKERVLYSTLEVNGWNTTFSWIWIHKREVRKQKLILKNKTR